jgi:C4-dicarboxylate transporter DctQ subunit
VINGPQGIKGTSGMTPAPAQSRLGQIINSIEENVIALFLGLMTVITFCNVIARYFFNSNILWQLETTVFLFAWLVLFGMSHCIKITSHLGVDVIINVASPKMRKLLALGSVAVCLVFCILLLKGGWDYWWKFANQASFLETKDIPMPGFLQFLSDLTNGGRPYEKLPRYVPYFILPLGMTLLTFRVLQAGYLILTTDKDRIIASHEAEDLVEEAAAKVAKDA